VSLGGAADDASIWKPIIPAREFNPLVDQVSQALRQPLDALVRGRLKDDERRRLTEPARGLALLIAAWAQSTAAEGEEARRHAAVRDAALRLERALNEGDAAAARKLLEELPSSRGDAQTKTVPVPLSDAEGRPEVIRVSMFLTRPRDRGGLGLEGTLNGLARSGNTRGTKPEETARIGYLVAALAQMNQSAAPLKKEGDKDPADWRRFTDEMREAGLELARAAAANDSAGVRTAAARTNGSCLNCHRVFRDN
jgi:hypothetical protein